MCKYAANLVNIFGILGDEQEQEGTEDKAGGRKYRRGASKRKGEGDIVGKMEARTERKDTEKYIEKETCIDWDRGRATDYRDSGK